MCGGGVIGRRHDALIPLTHDHHHVLAQARRLKEASGPAGNTSRRNVAGDFVIFYLGLALRHFHEEEELFFAPLVDDDMAGPLVARAVADHLRLHAQVRAIRRQLSGGEVDGLLLGSIAELLETHVRFEEKELFPLIESTMSDAELRELGSAGRRDV